MLLGLDVSLINSNTTTPINVQDQDMFGLGQMTIPVQSITGDFSGDMNQNQQGILTNDQQQTLQINQQHEPTLQSQNIDHQDQLQRPQQQQQQQRLYYDLLISSNPNPLTQMMS